MSQMEQGRQDPVVQLSCHQDLPLKWKRQQNLIAGDSLSDAAMSAALLMLGYTRLKNIFEMMDPIAVVKEAEWQAVTGFSPEVIELTEKLEEGLPGVDLQSLTPAARSHLQHVQYLDLLDDLRKSTEPDPEEVWKPVAILDHSLQTHNKDDVHVKVKVLWLNGEETWVRVNALLINEPILLTEYAQKNWLQSQLHS
jgi:hypothetical protein